MRIFAGLQANISEGFVWLRKAGLPPRCVVRITSPQKKTVYCEALQFEANFLKHYNQPPRLAINGPDSSIVMSGWYRARLGGLETQKDYALDIVQADSWPRKLCACKDHPQLVVRVALWLGILSVALGELGVVLGILGLRG